MDVKIILKSEHINSHYHLVLKILLNEFIKFINVDTNRVIENLKLAELKTKIANVFLNTQTRKKIYNYRICLYCNKNYKKLLLKT